MTYLTIALLGPMRVTLDQRPVTSFAYEKVRALLAYLVAEAKRAHSRGALAALLWADQAEAQARSNLRRALATLRHTLGDRTQSSSFFLTTRNTVQFNHLSHYSSDVAAFATHFNAYTQHQHSAEPLCPDCVAHLQQAIALYRGEFLHELSTHNSLAFEEWVSLTRHQFHRQAVDTCGRLALHYQQQQRWDQAQQYVQRQLELDVWNEAAHRVLMRILAMKGQRSTALQQYERCRQLFAQEFKVELDAETKALYEQIRQGKFEPHPQSIALRSPSTESVPLSALSQSAVPRSPSQLPVAKAEGAIPGNLPAATTRFIGREDELSTLTGLLLKEDVRLLTLTGTAGVGKTRLATTLASAVSNAFADGIYFVDLTAIAHPSHVGEAIAQRLGIQEGNTTDLTTRLVMALRNRQVLLLLDNFEHVLEANTLVSSLLAKCPLLKVLVTSRVKLRLYGEWEFPVSPLSLPDINSAPSCETSLESEAVQLFVARSQLVQLEFRLNDKNALTIGKICQRLEGLPLAIELAAAWSNLLSPEQLLAQLERRLTLLVNGACDLPLRHQSLQAAIEWSYNLLSLQEQAIFRRASVFAGGWTLEALATLCSDIVESNVIHTGVLTLVSHHLFQAQPVQGETRFTMLETLREYALAQLDYHTEIETVRQQHTLYYLQLVETSERQMQIAQEGFWLQRLSIEYDNIRIALDWALQQNQPEIVARMSGALHHFAYVCGHYSEVLGWLERSLTYRDRLSTPTLAKVLLGAGLLATRFQDYSRAANWCSESLLLLQQLEDSVMTLKARYTMGAIAVCQENYALAEYYFGYEPEIGITDPSPTTLHLMMTYLSIPLWVNKQYEQAYSLLEEGLALSRAMDSSFTTGICLLALSAVDLKSGNYHQARQRFLDCLVSLQAVNSKEGLCWLLEGFGGLATAEGKPILAAMLWGTADKVREEISAPRPFYGFELINSFIVTAREALGDEVFVRALEEGRTCSLPQAILMATSM